ncbi:MAG: serine/threonine-protein kinase [Myxococcota bacterium]
MDGASPMARDYDQPTRATPGAELEWAVGALPSQGDVIDGKYVLGERLGQGGMGVVYLANDIRLNRPVAIKLVHPVIADDPDLGAIFQREAESMAQLRHPNIVEIYDIGRVGVLRYLVMPYHKGDNLVQWISNNGELPLPVDVAIDLLVQICEGLEEMHSHGLIHGDVKPGNVLVSDTLAVTLVDLGLTRSIWELDDLDAVRGTPGYMAPELTRRVRHPLTPKVDIYALGVMAYYLLTGVRPRDGEDRPEEDPMRETIVLPSERRPSLGPGFDIPIVQALDLDPAVRPNIARFREALLAARETPGERPLVMLVDDDDNSLMLMAEIVRAAVDAEIVEFCDARAALCAIEERLPALVISDLLMPGMTGIDLTAALRDHPQTQEIPVVVVSAVGGADDWQVLQGLGSVCFLVKPIIPEVLSDVVHRMLRSRR